VIGDPHGVEPLTRLLRDEGRTVRREAASALGKIGDPRAVEPLARLLGDESVRVRVAAERALEKIQKK